MKKGKKVLKEVPADFILIGKIAKAKRLAARRARYRALRDLSVLHFTEYMVFVRKYYQEEIAKIQKGENYAKE